jgi:hypothetical protein
MAMLDIAKAATPGASMPIHPRVHSHNSSAEVTAVRRIIGNIIDTMVDRQINLDITIEGILEGDDLRQVAEEAGR